MKLNQFPLCPHLVQQQLPSQERTLSPTLWSQTEKESFYGILPILATHTQPTQQPTGPLLSIPISNTLLP